MRVLRVIARMNVGGPAYHVSILTGRLDRDRYESLLVAGRVGPGEGSLERVARDYGARVEHIRWLGPQLNPIWDLLAFVALLRLARAFRPHIIHTHTAKAGFVGRAVALAMRPRPIVVHTFHGHVLSGYFGAGKTLLFKSLERLMARYSDCLIGVSDATADELIALGVGSRERFRVIRLGLDLGPFLKVDRSAGVGFRDELGLTHRDVLAVFVGRLAPIKQVHILLRAVADARAAGAPIVLAVVGDGELRADLEVLAVRLGLDGHVHFAGFRHDLDAIAAATDIAVLSSANEGTPVALIEAAAAATPAVATDVGGVSDIVAPDTGRLVPPGDVAALSGALQELAHDEALRSHLGEAARLRVAEQYSADRLVREVDGLYTELLSRRAGRSS